MSNSENNNRIETAMARFASLAPASKSVARDYAALRPRTAVAASNAAGEVNNIAKNPIYLMMTDNKLSDEKKINAVADFLNAKDENYEGAREHFAAFEEYFSYAQNETVQVNVKGIERLIEDLRSGLKPEIERIVKSLIDVQQGIKESEKLLEVMRAARVEGKTVEEIGNALEANDQILAEIARINDDIRNLGETEVERQARLAAQEERKAESERGFFNKIARTVMGPNKSIAAAIELATEQLEAAKAEVTQTKEQLAARQAARNENLESGPLVILRTMDVTEKGFTEQLVKTAENSLGLINGATVSIERLMHRTLNGEAATHDILGKLAEGERRQAVLKGALQQVADKTFEQSQAIKTRLDAHDAKILASDNDVERAVMKAERVDIAQHHSGALDYSESLNRTVSNLESVSASDVEAKSQADQLSALIQSQKELLKRLGLEALPATARALQIVLQTNSSQQTAELSTAISSLTQQARKAGQDSLEKLLHSEGELEDHRLKNMDSAIEALRHAEDMVTQRIESTINNGIEERERMHGLSAAAGDLESIVSQLEEIRPTVTAREREESASRPSGVPSGNVKTYDAA